MSPDTPHPQSGAAAMGAEPPPPSSGRRWSPRSARHAIQPAMAPEPPPPRRPRGGLVAKLSAFFTLLVVLAVVGGGAIIYGRSVVGSPGPLQQDKVVFIPRGSGASEIAALLEQNGVISSAAAFEIYQIVQSILSGGQPLRAGEYEFKQHASLKAVRETLVSGRPVQHRISIPEGLTSEQIVQRLRENDILEGEIRNIPREGSLLPDTYAFERGTSRERLLARMESEQRRVLQEIWSRRSPDIPLKNPAELVILASIVEKETGRADERTRVASVFINRLNRGMKLESDPTIIYGLVGGKGSLGRGILASEIRQPTPYNTYVINGLPPGPIANPGRAAMEATANPSKTRDIFFVADGTGGHVFAETYEQHQRNVARWRQIESGQGAGAPAAPPAAAPPPAATPQPPVQRQRQQRSEAEPSRQAPSPVAAASRAVDPQTTSPFAIPQADLRFVTPPASGGPAGGQATAFAADPPMEAPPAAAQRRPRAFDASEGTPRDPLRNRSFDLNSPKTVPTLR